MATSNVRDFISKLGALQSEIEFRRTLDEALRALGYSQFSYVGMDLELKWDSSLVEIEPDLIHMTNRPDWGRRYVEENYAKHDLIVHECFSSRLPIRWTEAFMANVRTPEEAVFMEDAWENGIKQGVTMPIHGPKGEFAVLMLSCNENEKEFARLTDECQYDLQIMAHYFHDALQKTVRKKVPPPIALTSREIEILKWTVDGKTAWEIGQIVNISERTVNFHLRNIMAKFGVHNKTHAAAKAVNLGLFSSSGARALPLSL